MAGVVFWELLIDKGSCDTLTNLQIPITLVVTTFKLFWFLFTGWDKTLYM